MKISIRKKAVKDLKSIDKIMQEKIKKEILNLKNFPAVKNIKKLVNFEPAYRLRVGDYRILFDVENEEITVGRILHRKDSYKWKYQ